MGEYDLSILKKKGRLTLNCHYYFYNTLEPIVFLQLQVVSCEVPMEQKNDFSNNSNIVQYNFLILIHLRK